MMSVSVDTKTAPIHAAAGKKMRELEWNACTVDGQTDRQTDSFIDSYLDDQSQTLRPVEPLLIRTIKVGSVFTSEREKPHKKNDLGHKMSNREVPL